MENVTPKKFHSSSRITSRQAGATPADLDVLALMAREGRILLTFDEDFGELARSSRLPSACGVLLLGL